MFNQLINRWRVTLLATTTTLSLFFSVSLLADDHDKARKLVESGDILPLEIILEQLNKRAKGRVIDVELEHEKGHLVYEIELLDAQGIVREFIFNASDGRLLKEEIED